jgi:Fur family peroxide stress response transcriptional regulator
MQKGKTETQRESFESLFKKHNLRITPQRVAIYMRVVESGAHPSADEVFKEIREEFPHISYDTVNRTLHTFSKIGIVDIVEGMGEPRRYDPCTKQHHHFHCIRCGKIIDFFDDDYDRLEVPERISHTHDVISTRVVLHGLCGKCKNMT